MEISKKDKKLLVYLLALSIIAGSYFFGARIFLDKQYTVSNEANSLKIQVSHLNDIYNNSQNYENRIVTAQQRANELEEKFFGGFDQESTLILIDKIEKDTKVWISRVSFQEYAVISDNSTAEAGAPQDVENIEGTESTAGDTDNTISVDNGSAFSGLEQDLILDYECNYADFKNFLEYIENYDQRLFISAINASYIPDSNQISGSLSLSQFALTGPGREKPSLDLSAISTGVDNVFTTLNGTTQTEEGQGIEAEAGTISLEGEDSQNDEGNNQESAEEGNEGADRNEENEEAPEQAEETSGPEQRKPRTGGVA